MSTSTAIRSITLAILFGALLCAQDAGLVLRTRVSYGTQRASLPLNDEERKQADALLRDADQANQAGKYGEAMRSLLHGMAVMNKQPWTPQAEYVASLRLSLEHAVVEPGTPVHVKTTALYPTREDAKAPMNCGTPPDAPGNYTIECRFGAELPAKSLPVHVESLSADVQALRTRLAKAPKRDGLPTAEYALALFERADAGEVNPTRVNFREEFAKANAILDAIEAGKDPFAGQHGDSRRAYRSAVDNTLQPYRLFIPETYDGKKPAPLVIALHGMGGDENSMFDSYANGLLKREAGKHGFLVACPKGRDTASMYRGAAEQDVLDVLAEVQRAYRVDASRIYLMGHSMGAYGTWSIAMAHPDLFAALGPIAGGGSAAGMTKIRHIPQYVVHGDDDRTVNVSQSRTMVEAGKKAGAEIEYHEIPGGSHVGVAAPAFAPMLDFFAKQQKRAGER